MLKTVSHRSSAANMDPQEDKDILFIGIDFGTTFSGVAWAYSKDPESIETLTSWNSDQAYCSDKEKAPTVLSFDDADGPDSVAWGYKVSPGQKTIKWFKLLLLKEKDIDIHVLHSSQYQKARKTLEQLQNNPTELVSAYIRELWEHTLDEIKRSLGRTTLEISELHVVVTLPAIWPAYAQQYMHKALEMCGIMDARPAGQTTIRFIPEPEAAALATINDLSKRATLKRGDTMTVCDAGGGTVDLISYKIQKIRPFVVKEIVPGDGGLCGAVFLDEAFLDLIKAKIAPGSWDLASESDKAKFLNVEWENGIKPEFNDEGEKKWLVQLPEACEPLSDRNDLKRSRHLEITTEEIRKVFDSVTDKIVELVKRQANEIFAKTSRRVDFIVLVGGFGRCRYLYDRINHVAEDYHACVLQSKGSKPWSSIARGAVVNCLTKFNLAANLGVLVGSRISRFSFGVKHSTHFVEGEHDERDRRWVKQERAYKAMDQMRWFLKQGEDIDDHDPVRQKFYYLLRETEELGRNPLQIYATSSPEPPIRGKDPAVIKLCTLKWRGEVDLKQVPMWKNPGGEYFHKLEYEIIMRFDMGAPRFEIECQGETIGREEIDVEFDDHDG